MVAAVLISGLVMDKGNMLLIIWLSGKVFDRGLLRASTKGFLCKYSFHVYNLTLL